MEERKREVQVWVQVGTNFVRGSSPTQPPEVPLEQERDCGNEVGGARENMS